MRLKKFSKPDLMVNLVILTFWIKCIMDIYRLITDLFGQGSEVKGKIDFFVCPPTRLFIDFT